MNAQLICSRSLGDHFGDICNFAVEASPTHPFLRAEIASRKSDLAKTRVQQFMPQGSSLILAKAQPWKAIFFDMDSTVVGQESIVELARFAGTADRVHEITERAMAGEINFDAALQERVATLKNQPSSILEEVLSRFTINPGMPALAEQARSQGIRLFLVSGGFMPLAAAIAKQLNFDAWRANELESQAGRLTGKIQGRIINAQAKKDFVLEMCAKYEIDPNTAIAVGDGANDLDMLGSVGLAIGYQPKEVLFKHLDGVLYGNFDALTYLIDLS